MAVGFHMTSLGVSLVNKFFLVERCYVHTYSCFTFFCCAETKRKPSTNLLQNCLGFYSLICYSPPPPLLDSSNSFQFQFLIVSTKGIEILFKKFIQLDF